MTKSERMTKSEARINDHFGAKHASSGELFGFRHSDFLRASTFVICHLSRGCRNWPGGLVVPLSRCPEVRDAFEHVVNLAGLLPGGNHADDHAGKNRVFAQSGGYALAALDVQRSGLDRL